MNSQIQSLERAIDVARGLVPADLVLKNTTYLDVFSGQWLKGDIAILDDRVVGVGESYKGKKEVDLKRKYVVPGFIDSHVHIESSLMAPGEFEKAVLLKGTTTVIADPHEIANVLGLKGIEYILACAEKSTLDIRVMLSSCVPATHLETSGATITAKDLLKYKNHPKVLGLAEMMNYPGLLNKDPQVLEKIAAFQDGNIDGHSPLLRGKDLNAYLACGIKTCHESVEFDEAKEKLQKGMQVLLREGSVAKNLHTLVKLLDKFSSPKISLCTDDRNPLDIAEEGHLDFLIRQAIKKKIDPASVYRAASWSTANCYGMKNLGAIAPGFKADLVILDNYKTCQVFQVIKSGRFIKSEKDIPAPQIPAPTENSMNFEVPSLEALQLRGAKGLYRTIGVVPGEIITRSLQSQLENVNGCVQPNLKKDVLKIVVAERYGHNHPPAVGFVNGMGLKRGAIGSSVGHDSHNAVVIGTNDNDMQKAFSRLKETGGGFVAILDGKVLAELPLPLAGLMTTEPHLKVKKQIQALRAATKKLGCPLTEPFLQMAFLCLPVIPELKITDRGLVDVSKFALVDAYLS